MTEFPDSTTVDVLREIITLCKNEKVRSIKCGPIELTFLPDESKSYDEDVEKRLRELQARRAEEDYFAAGGFVPKKMSK
jgi:hypothetical protein